MEDKSPTSLLNEVSYGDPEAVEPENLLDYLDSSDRDRRVAAAKGLARLGTTAPERVEPHATALQRFLEETECEVFANLLAALAAVAQEVPSAVSVTPPIIEGLAADEPKVREWSALVVAYVGGPPAAQQGIAVERLERLLNDEVAGVRRNAALGLARLGETESLRKLLSDDSDFVRETVKRILSQ